MKLHPKPQALTSTQKLQIAWQRMGVRISRECPVQGLKPSLINSSQNVTPRPKSDLHSLATCGFEQSTARFYNEHFHDYDPLLGGFDPEKRRFLFRCYLVPEFATILIAGAMAYERRRLGNVITEPPWYVWEPATYLIALERTFLEMLLVKAKKNVVEVNGLRWEVPVKVKESCDLPTPSFDWFRSVEIDYPLQEERFDQWRLAAASSLNNYFKFNCSQIGNYVDPCEQAAALCGAIENLTPFPSQLVGDIIENFRMRRPRTASIFYKCAAKPERDDRVTDIALDTWLREIHPLTERNGWTCNDVLQIARKKFGNKNQALTSVDSLMGHIRRQKLKLSVSPGRPKKHQPEISNTKEMAWLARFTNSVGIENRRWLCGQLGLSEVPIRV